MPPGNAIVIRGDARNLPLPDACVDTVITSPPYWALRSYTDGGQHYDGQIGAEPTPREYIDNLVGCTREWMRVLKPTGSLFVNLGDKYNAYNGNRGEGTIQRNGIRQNTPQGAGLDAAGMRPKTLMGMPWRYALRCIDDLGLILRAEIVWSKPNGLPESVTDRVRRSHETWFHLTKQPRYFAAADEIRLPHRPGSIARRSRDRRHAYAPPVQQQQNGLREQYNEKGALPGSVWDIATTPFRAPAELGVAHFAAFPPEWPRRLILGWSPPGGIVLDPFGGTGTTAMVARALGRTGISVDLSADYCRLARWRTNDRPQLAKVPGGSPPLPAGLEPLF